MMHIPDLIKLPVIHRHPILSKYRRFFQHRDRFIVGETITLIELFHHSNGIEKTCRINYYLQRCENRNISIKTISARLHQVTITEKIHSALNTYDYVAIGVDDNRKYYNVIPRVSIYLDIFPAVYYEWECDGKYFVAFDFAFEYSLVHCSRFKALFNHLKYQLVQGNIGYEKQKNGHIKKIY